MRRNAMSSITVARATIDNLSDIVSFQIAMALETEGINLDEAVITSGVKAVFDDPSKGVYFIVKDGDKAIASNLITYEWSDWRNRNIWWIQSVYVRPEYRKQGVFKTLYNHLKEQVELNNIGGLRLYVDKTNTRANEVYTRLGMDGEHYDYFEWMKS
jgi:ribosomal protein S18 acetylase RimI-like enzyme